MEESQQPLPQVSPEHSGGPDANCRRGFLKGAVALSLSLSALGAGAFICAFRYFKRPGLTAAQSEELTAQRLSRMEDALSEEKLRLARASRPSVAIAPLTDLNGSTGKYFIDYEMGPALAFKGDDGRPILLSARCTHLGCTVGNQVNEKGQILCPCHISYFDIKTGLPSQGSPAKRPLAHLPWVLKDKNGFVIASSADRGRALKAGEEKAGEEKAGAERSQEEKSQEEKSQEEKSQEERAAPETYEACTVYLVRG